MKRLRFIILIVMFIFLNTTISTAVSLTIKASKTTAKKGDSVNITVNGTGISGRINLSVSGNGKLTDSSVWVDNSRVSTTLKINGTGKIIVTANPTDISDSNSGDAITNIRGVSTTINVASDSSNGNNTNDNISNNDVLLKDATLKNLGIRPNDFSGFRKGIPSYSVSVPKNVDKVSIYAEATNPKATVSGTGTKSLQIGKNTFNIKVIAEDKKTTKTYTLIITRKSEDENASDATLTNLGIRPKEYDFTGFKTGTLSYNASVPNDVDKITIYATAKSDKATVTGIGSKTLKVGANRCEIMVTSENKKATKTYVINVTRKEKEEKPEEDEDETDAENENNTETTTSNEEKLSDGLKNILVKGYNLEPSFSQDVHSYKINVPSSNGKLEIDTETTGDNIEVEVAGNEELRQGENIITVLVHDTKDDSTLTYQITANVEKYLSAENSVIVESEQKDKMKTWIIIGIISAIIIFIIILFIRKYKRENEEYFDEDYEDENIYEPRNEYYTQRNRYEEQKEDEDMNETNRELRDIGLFDDKQKIEFEDYDEPKRHGKYRGRRFK